MFTNKALKNLIIPLVVEQILVMLVGMVDTMIVSHAGEAAIYGVALVDMISFHAENKCNDVYIGAYECH